MDDQPAPVLPVSVALSSRRVPGLVLDRGVLTIVGRREGEHWTIDQRDVRQVVWVNPRTRAEFASPLLDPAPSALEVFVVGDVLRATWVHLHRELMPPPWLARVARRWRWLRRIAGSSSSYLWTMPTRAIGVHVRGDPIAAKRAFEAWGCEFPKQV